MKRVGTGVALALSLLLFACTRSHAAPAAPSDARVPRDTGANYGDAGRGADVHVAGPADGEGDLLAYCALMTPMLDDGCNGPDWMECRRLTCDAVIWPENCHPTTGELNQCLDIARSLYEGTPLLFPTIPFCNTLCPHPDAC